MQVSVIIPCYNVGAFAVDGIDSIINQTYEDLEILCLDDASTDDTFEILLGFSKKDLRVKVFRNESNQGLVNTLNKLVQLSSNDILVRMDPDDIADKERISILMNKYLETGADVVSSNYSLINESGCKIKKNGFDLLTTPLGIKYTACYNSPIPHSPSLLKKSNVLAYPYSTNYKAAEDYDLWVSLLLSKDLKVEILTSELYLYRMNPLGMSLSNHHLQAQNHIKIAKRYTLEMLQLKSDEMDFWELSKKCYDWHNINVDKLLKTLNQILAVRKSFLSRYQATKDELNEINVYTAQYLLYTYFVLIKQSFRERKLIVGLTSVIISLASSFKIIATYRNLRWLIKNI